jgi:hypothetical protein
MIHYSEILEVLGITFIMGMVFMLLIQSKVKVLLNKVFSHFGDKE